MEYKCNFCNYIYSTKFSLERHLNNKRKCTEKTEFKCNKCNKCFKQKKNLLSHQKEDVCLKLFKSNTPNIQSSNDELEKNISELIDSELSNKLFLFKKLGVKMTDNEINELLNSKTSKNLKITCFINDINSKNIISNNISNSNNTTNNIQINNFGKENIDYIKPSYIIDLVKNNKGKASFLKLSNEIYLNKTNPQNNTIKIDNINNKFCKVIEDNKWITTTKDKALQNIFIKVADILMKFMDDLSDSIPEKQMDIINDYLNKDFEDIYIKETVKEFILNIYNFTINEI
jgi:hypothetical protein|uniref:C2H2-type domain-containing protein n=1 Tax=viral metagenome TaxID=1070528 RepID=A0A6C0H0P3_9ZZZZ